jgi:hypothetical protein
LVFIIFLSGFFSNGQKGLSSDIRLAGAWGKNTTGKRKATSEDGPNGDWIEATIPLRHDRNGKPAVGAARSATGFPLLLH